MMAALNKQPSSASCTELLRCNVVEFSVTSSWSMMQKCDLTLGETDIRCVVQTALKCEIMLEDLVGVQVLQKPHPQNSLACQLDIHSYPLVQVGFFGGKKSRRITTNSFCFYQEPTFRENLYAAVQWKKAINKQCRTTMQRVFCSEESGLQQAAEVTPLQLLIFINPFGGTGKAEQLFDEHVRPMFDMAEVQSTIIVTKRQNHARDVIKSYDFSTIDSIVVSAGDGLLFEVVNGIMERPDWETAIRKPIGILPTGSGNGVSASLLHESKEDFSLSNAAFLIIRGGAIPMDVASVETHDGGRCFMSLAMGWGLVADVDIESEKMRRLGETRFVLGSISCILKRNAYRGILHYLPLEDHVEDDGPQQLMDPQSGVSASSTTSTAQGGGGGPMEPRYTAGGAALPLHGFQTTVDGTEPTATVATMSTGGEQNGEVKERDGEVKERDGEVKERDGEVKERDGEVKERDGEVKERDGEVKERDGEVKERDGEVREEDEEVKEKGGEVKEKDKEVRGGEVMKEKDGEVKEKNGEVKEGEAMQIEGMEKDEGPTYEQTVTKTEPNGRDIQRDDHDVEQRRGDNSCAQHNRSEDASKEWNPGKNTSLEHNQDPTNAEHSAQNTNVPVEQTRVKCGPRLESLPHLSENVPSSWKTLTVNLLSFSAILTSHLSRSFVGDPTKRIGSGVLLLAVFRSEMSRFSLLKVLTGSESGEHLNLNTVTVLKTRAFRLEVLTEPGMITVDGEAMPYGTMQVELHPGVARIMCRRRREQVDSQAK